MQCFPKLHYYIFPILGRPHSKSRSVYLRIAQISIATPDTQTSTLGPFFQALLCHIELLFASELPTFSPTISQLFFQLLFKFVEKIVESFFRMEFIGGPNFSTHSVPCNAHCKGLAKCSSYALTLCQYDPPVKSYDQIKFWCDVPIVITM